MKRVFRAAVALMTAATTILIPALGAGAIAGPTDQVFFSEIHYDNTGTDTGEAIEIFGPAGTDLDGWSIVLYNGNGGAPYNTTALTGTIPSLDSGFGVVHVSYPSNGIQNGPPDGMALVDNTGVVRQFLSYEGVFSAVGGPADGLLSTDIGISQSGSEPIGSSLALTGEGSCYGDFAWTATTTHSFGALGDITIGECDPTVDPDPDPDPDPLPDVRFSEIHYDNAGVDVGEAIEVLGPAGTDLDGWSIVLYNGTGGAVYNTNLLTGEIPDLAAGFGVVVVSYPTNGIQNGSPDGMALVDAGGNVVEFLSYEGSFTAVGGPADGMTSTDIGVSEPTDALADRSLQRDADGAWYGPRCHSFGAVNDPDGLEFCPVELKIHEVQGNGAVTPYAGRRVIVEGIVTADHQGPAPGLRGFFVQEEDGHADADPLTSEGIFVFNAGAVEVAVGDLVRIEGTASEFFSNTQLSFADIEVLSSGNPLPAPTVVEFPLATGPSDLEAVEGMLVTFPDALVISEYFNYDRFGEIVVAKPVEGETRVMNPTALFGQGSVEAADRLDVNLRSRITVDDGLGGENPETLIHPINRLPFSAANSFRGGDTVTGLTGPIYYSFGLYRILPLAEPYADGDGSETVGFAEYQRTTAPPTPDDVGGDVRVAAFNALNYFLTIGGTCGPAQDMDCRGADDTGEFERQRVKLLNALEVLDADVIGLNEVENTPGVEALADLASGLNDRLGAGTYAHIAAGDDSVVGTDAIKVGLIYKPDVVTPVGDPVVLDDPAFLDPLASGEDKNRAAVAQTFFENETGEVFSVVVNHFKSKGSGCPGDFHLLAGNCAATRAATAGYLADWIETDPTGVDDDDWLIVGDLNSYDKEDTIVNLVDAGFTDLVEDYLGTHAYSYVFDGQAGYLDYIMSSASMTPQVTGATVWNINADESDVYDYDTSFKGPQQEALFDPTTPYRSSDHDIVLVGLSLTEHPVVVEADPDVLWPPNHTLRAIELTAGDGSATEFDAAAIGAWSSEADSGLGDDDIPGDIVIDDGAVWVRAERYSLDGRTYSIRVLAVGDGQAVVRLVTVTVDHDQRDRQGRGR